MMRVRLSLLVLCPMSVFLLGGCPPSNVIEPTLTSIHEVIIQRSCNSESCHGGSSPEADLDLSTVEASYAALVGVASTEEPSFTRVVAGDSDNSLLYMVLVGQVGGIDQMPPGYTLDTEEVDAIRQWIDDGAAND